VKFFRVNEFLLKFKETERKSLSKTSIVYLIHIAVSFITKWEKPLLQRTISWEIIVLISCCKPFVLKNFFTLRCFGKLKENDNLYCTYVWIGWEWRQCLLRNSTDLKRIAFSSGDKERISLKKKWIRSDLIQKSYKLLFKYTTFRRHTKDDKFYSQKPRILLKKYRI
jgi:hypothetical protein